MHVAGKLYSHIVVVPAHKRCVICPVVVSLGEPLKRYVEVFIHLSGSNYVVPKCPHKNVLLNFNICVYSKKRITM
jgi:hypothetical protein